MADLQGIILNLKDYQRLLERLEDLKVLKEMRKKTLKFSKLEEFLHN
ncbi:MAG: hypothetical protein HYU63_08205 [Armatimonadetes bacterium]|nr:hypothetical protein [Armatimonadota bacterium]